MEMSEDEIIDKLMKVRELIRSNLTDSLIPLGLLKLEEQRLVSLLTPQRKFSEPLSKSLQVNTGHLNALALPTTGDPRRRQQQMQPQSNALPAVAIPALFSSSASSQNLKTKSNVSGILYSSSGAGDSPSFNRPRRHVTIKEDQNTFHLDSPNDYAAQKYPMKSNDVTSSFEECANVSKSCHGWSEEEEDIDYIDEAIYGKMPRDAHRNQSKGRDKAPNNKPIVIPHAEDFDSLSNKNASNSASLMANTHSCSSTVASVLEEKEIRHENRRREHWEHSQLEKLRERLSPSPPTSSTLPGGMPKLNLDREVDLSRSGHNPDYDAPQPILFAHLISDNCQSGNFPVFIKRWEDAAINCYDSGVSRFDKFNPMKYQHMGKFLEEFWHIEKHLLDEKYRVRREDDRDYHDEGRYFNDERDNRDKDRDNYERKDWGRHTDRRDRDNSFDERPVDVRGSNYRSNIPDFCKFFGPTTTCKNGSKCKFMHIDLRNDSRSRDLNLSDIDPDSQRLHSDEKYYRDRVRKRDEDAEEGECSFAQDKLQLKKKIKVTDKLDISPAKFCIHLNQHPFFCCACSEKLFPTDFSKVEKSTERPRCNSCVKLDKVAIKSFPTSAHKRCEYKNCRTWKPLILFDKDSDICNNCAKLSEKKSFHEA